MLLVTYFPFHVIPQTSLHLYFPEPENKTAGEEINDF